MTIDEAIKHCEEKEREQALNGCFACAEEHKQLAEVLKELKTLKERPQGEWIIVKSPLSNETIVKCDKCGDEFIGNDVEDYNFCPNCGADMRKGEEE